MEYLKEIEESIIKRIKLLENMRKDFITGRKESVGAIEDVYSMEIMKCDAVIEELASLLDYIQESFN